MKFNTLLLHGDYQGDKNSGATWTPIYQSSAFSHGSAEQLEKIFHNQAPGYSYTRINNPTIDAFEKRVTAIEGGIASVACASGMAALFNAFTNILRAGDEIVSSASLYGGSIDLFRNWRLSALPRIMWRTIIWRHSDRPQMNTPDSILRRLWEIPVWM